MGLSGFEPPTSRLSVGRSNRLSYKPILSGFSVFIPSASFEMSSLGSSLMVEISGIEPLTPCLQSRCSPSWAIPPYISGRTLKIKQRFQKFFVMLTLDVWLIYFIQSVLHRKEVIQPHLPIRLPCYDFTPVANPTFGSVLLSVRLLTSGITGSHGVTGGVYKARERIHRGMLIRDY